MTQTIGPDDVAALCLGSVFLATGGGGDPYVNQLLTEKALRKHGSIQLVMPDALPDDALVVAMGEAGAPMVRMEQLPVGDEPLKALRAYEEATKRTVTHVIPFEIGGGNSVLPLIAAAALGLPVVDGDGMGRALPEAQMMTFPLAGIAPTPALAIDYRDDTVLFNTKDTAAYERQLRALLQVMGGMVLTVEFPMTAADIRAAAVPGTLSLALKLGQLLRSIRGEAEAGLPHIITFFETTLYRGCKQLFAGKVVDFERRTVGGFDVGTAQIDSLSGETARIDIRNEYLAITVGDTPLATVPDLITLIDEESSQPINAERLSFGQRVRVLGIGAPAHFQTDAALEVVGPKALGLPFTYTPIA
ncbi:MAG: DUF917 domain-containing protein [Pseudomonadota bacterium]